MFRIKLCGLTTADDARLALEAGADAVGLNFFAGSPGCLDLPRARNVISAVKNRVVAVGVFVNAGSRTILEFAEDLGLDLVQLHGDEPPDLLLELKEITVMRAFRLG